MLEAVKKGTVSTGGGDWDQAWGALGALVGADALAFLSSGPVQHVPTQEPGGDPGAPHPGAICQ